MENFEESIKALVPSKDSEKWVFAPDFNAKVAVITIHTDSLPCGCESWGKNEPHPGYPLRAHYGSATSDPKDEFTIIVDENGNAFHYHCGRQILNAKDQLFQKEDKVFDEMKLCKEQNPQCGAVECTLYPTGGQLGSIGAGQYKAPGLKCELCKSKHWNSDELKLHSLGWY